MSDLGYFKGEVAHVLVCGQPSVTDRKSHGTPAHQTRDVRLPDSKNLPGLRLTSSDFFFIAGSVFLDTPAPRRQGMQHLKGINEPHGRHGAKGTAMARRYDFKHGMAPLPDAA